MRLLLLSSVLDDRHDGACVLEQASTASDMQLRVRTVSSLRKSSFKPIASTKLAGAKR